MRLAETTWPAVAAAERLVLVVPVGSLEQHGPHLPMDTDTRAASLTPGTRRSPAATRTLAGPRPR